MHHGLLLQWARGDAFHTHAPVWRNPCWCTSCMRFKGNRLFRVMRTRTVWGHRITVLSRRGLEDEDPKPVSGCLSLTAWTWSHWTRIRISGTVWLDNYLSSLDNYLKWRFSSLLQLQGAGVPVSWATPTPCAGSRADPPLCAGAWKVTKGPWSLRLTNCPQPFFNSLV